MSFIDSLKKLFGGKNESVVGKTGEMCEECGCTCEGDSCDCSSDGKCEKCECKNETVKQ